MQELKKEEIEQISEVLDIAREFNLFDESYRGQQLSNEFFKKYEEIFKQLFRQGVIYDYPELYKYFFINTKVPKIYSKKNYGLFKAPYPYDDDAGKVTLKNFMNIKFDRSYCIRDEYYKRICESKLNKSFRDLSENFSYLPTEIRETVFYFCRMCHLLGHAYYSGESKGEISFHCKQWYYEYTRKRSFLYFIVLYKEDDFEYYLVGDLEIPCDSPACTKAFYDGIQVFCTDMFKNVETLDLNINFEYLNSKTKCRLEDIYKIVEYFDKNFPEFKEALSNRLFNAKMTSLEVLREEANYFNLVILPIEYSKFRLSNKYKKVISQLGPCNVFVITTLDNYDIWAEIIDEQKDLKSKFFPTALSQLELSIQFSISSQKTLYQMLNILEERVDELENTFNKNMRIVEKQIKQLRAGISILDVQVENLAMKIAGLEFKNINSYREKMLNDRTSDLDKLMDLIHSSDKSMQDIESIMSASTDFEDFKLELIKKKTEIKNFIQEIDQNEYVFVYTTANDLYEDAIAYTIPFSSI